KRDDPNGTNSVQIWTQDLQSRRHLCGAQSLLNRIATPRDSRCRLTSCETSNKRKTDGTNGVRAPERVHAHRIACRDCDYRNTCRATSSCAEQSKKQSTCYLLSKQPEATATRMGDVRG